VANPKESQIHVAGAGDSPSCPRAPSFSKLEKDINLNFSFTLSTADSLFCLFIFFIDHRMRYVVLEC
jgi:hypothetical protein